jgi:pimeloyl-ACP methyl ester carboxylesterase
VTRYFRQDFLTTPDGARLLFEVYGEGENAIVMCDGVGCDGFAWKYLLPEMAREHRVIRWHYRGHGKSGVPEDPTRVGFQHAAEDLALVLDSAGVREAIVFGHSMGVQIALEFHRRYADRVKALVLLNGSYGFTLDTVHDDALLRHVIPWVRSLVEVVPGLASRTTRWLLKTELALQVALSFELNRELLSRQDLLPYFEHLANMDPVVFVRTLSSLSEHDAWDHLPRIKVPTLVVGGERDRFTPLWLSRRMADAISDSEFVIIPQGSHAAPLEQPGLVGERVSRFLGAKVLRAPPGAPETFGSTGSTG